MIMKINEAQLLRERFIFCSFIYQIDIYKGVMEIKIFKYIIKKPTIFLLSIFNKMAIFEL